MDQLSEGVNNLSFRDHHSSQMNPAATAAAATAPYFMNNASLILASLPHHPFAMNQAAAAAATSAVPAGLGLDSLYNVCRAYYPNQPNPLQVNAVQKMWLGGPDPLDFISMYSDPGVLKQEGSIPPHWTYISFGLSDLYGDGRVFDPVTSHALQNSRNRVSGYGFELTFRLKKQHKDESPPTWPATVMQSLAKYVFSSDNALCPGDHVSWHCSLDNSDSRIRHMLMTEDPIGTVMTPYGSVTFVQIIGVCAEELQAAQQWNGSGLIDLMKLLKESCHVVTDMRRQKTIFEIDDKIRELVDDGISTDGSNLSGVTAKCSWKEVDDSSMNHGTAGDKNNHSRESSGSKTNGDTKMSPSIISTGHEDDEHGDRATLSPNGRNKICASRSSRHSSMSTSDPNNAVVVAAAAPDPLSKITYPKSVHLTLNLEAGNILPLAIKGRLKHGRHFTLKTVAGDLAVTLLTEAVSGAAADMNHPYALQGPWLQVLIPSKSLEAFTPILDSIPSLTQESLPQKFYLPGNRSFSITIAPDDDLH